MAEYTHSFVFNAGVLEIIDNVTGNPVVYQPTNPNTGLGWASEAEAMTYGQQQFGYMYQQQFQNPTTELPYVNTSTSTITVGTGE